MAGRGSGPDFVESLARGLDVLRCFDEHHREMSLAEVANATGLARPTARRLLLTLEELGYVRSIDGAFSLTPKVITLGTAYVASLGLWEVARPHLEALVRQTGESSSMAQLDGGDIIYVARVSVPKIIALRVEIGTLFPAPQTSQGKVLLAALSAEDLDATLAIPSRSGLPRYIGKSREALDEELAVGPCPRLGDRRRGARSRGALDRRTRPRRHRHRARRDERHRARRRDEHRDAARRAPPQAPPRCRRRERRLGHLAGEAASRSARVGPHHGHQLTGVM